MNYKRNYLIILIYTISIIVFSFYYLSFLSTESYIINIIGKQRMLTLAITEEISPNFNISQEGKKLLSTYKHNYEILKNGGLLIINNKKIHIDPIFSEIEFKEPFSSYLSNFEAIIYSNDEIELNTKLINNKNDIVNLYDFITNDLSEIYQNKTQHLIISYIIVFALSLLFVTYLLKTNNDFNPQLEKQKKYLDNLFDSIDIGLLLIDKHGQIKRANQYVFSNFGWTKEELYDEKIDDLLLGYEQYYHFLSKHKYKYLVSIDKNPLLNEGDVVITINNAESIYLKDQSLNFLGEIIEEIPIPMFILNYNGLVTHWNRACESFSNTKKEDVLYSNKYSEIFSNNSDLTLADYALMFDKLTKEEIIEKFKSVNSYYSNSSIYIEDCTIYAKKFIINCNKFCKIISKPIFSIEKRVIGAIEFIIDDTDNILLQQTLEEAKETAEQVAHEKTSFLANMSHEIRTPLSSIISQIQFINQEKNLPNHVKIRAAKVDNSSKVLLSMINNILDYSKFIYNEKIDIDYQPTDLDELIQSVVDSCSGKADEKNLPIYISIATDVPNIINTDSVKLSQVLINLLSNSIKFTLQGFILVKITKQDNFLKFKIVDTGCGIDENSKSKIFDPFKQADSSITKKIWRHRLRISYYYY